MTTWGAQQPTGVVPGIPGVTGVSITAVSQDGNQFAMAANGGISGFLLSAIWWAFNAGYVVLPPLAGASDGATADSISGNGSKVVGSSDYAGSPGPTFFNQQAVLWTITGDIIIGVTVVTKALGFLGAGQASSARGISFDGTKAVGSSSAVPGYHPSVPGLPCVWDLVANTITALPLLVGTTDGAATACSYNGDIVVGFCFVGSTSIPCIWIGGVVTAIPFAGGATTGQALCCSLDGSAVGGFMGTLEHPFLSNGSGVALLPLPFIQTDAKCIGMSGNGVRLIGLGIGTSGGMGSAWTWTLAGGYEDLPTLAVLGSPAIAANAISTDGTTPGGASGVTAVPTYWTPDTPITPIPFPFCGDIHTTTSFTAAWTIGSPADTYTVDWRKVGDIDFTEVTSITDMFLLITGLLSSTTYEFKVDAITSGVHSGFSNLVQCSTDGIIRFPPGRRIPFPPIPPSPIPPVVIPLRPIPSQTITITLSNQSCRINVRQTSTGIYLDLYVNDTLIIGGVHCQDLNPIVRNRYLGFIGDLAFYDTQPSTITGPNDPVYTGLGSRYVLEYYQDAP